MELSSLNDLINSGQYQTAYDKARMGGYDPTQISNYVNTTYGTNWSPDTLTKDYENTSLKNLYNQNKGYATYSNGVGQGTPGQVGANYLAGTWSNPNQPQTQNTGNTVIGGTQNMGSVSNTNMPVKSDTSASNYSMTQGLNNLFPRLNWSKDQSYNRGSRYFDTNSGNYKGLGNITQL